MAIYNIYSEFCPFKMVMFHSYVSEPEGRPLFYVYVQVDSC